MGMELVWEPALAMGQGALMARYRSGDGPALRRCTAANAHRSIRSVARFKKARFCYSLSGRQPVFDHADRP
jgi:hypothetical protein